jgi:hypothetical protein
MSALDKQVGGRHYRNYIIQPVEFIHRNGLGFLEGCIVKRLCRHRDKGGAQDLMKALHEIELLLEMEYPAECAALEKIKNGDVTHQNGAQADNAA